MLVLTLALAFTTANPAPAAADAARASFEEKCEKWTEVRHQTLGPADELFKSIRKTDAEVSSRLRKILKDAVAEEGRQLGLHRALVRNQDLALQDKVINEERHRRHVAQLDRNLNERMLLLWARRVPTGINELLKPHAKRLVLKGFPLERFLTEEDWNRFHREDFIPTYDKKTGRMEVVKPQQGTRADPR